MIYFIHQVKENTFKPEKGENQVTREEIIAFINRTLETNPNAFCEDVIIEDYYIYVPSIEFVKDAITGEWRAI